MKSHFYSETQPKNWLKYNESLTLNDKIFQVLHNTEAQTFKAKLDQSISYIDETIQANDVKNLVICFNGGKDATVVLYLFLARYAAYLEASKKKIIVPPAVFYAKTRTDFNEIKDFVADITERFGLDLYIVPGSVSPNTVKSMLQRFQELRSVTSNNVIFIMGQRSTDNKVVQLRQNSTYPNLPFTILNPLVDWNYGEIWYFLRTSKFAYCSLYDKGYSSLGDRLTSNANPALLKKQGYLPAFELEKEFWSSERANRK